MKKQRQICVPPEVFTGEGKVTLEEIQEAIQSLARKGLIVDSGQRRWSERTQSYHIVWVAASGAKLNRLLTQLARWWAAGIIRAAASSVGARPCWRRLFSFHPTSPTLPHPAKGPISEPVQTGTTVGFEGFEGGERGARSQGREKLK